jgi:hypothetical protein
MCGNMRRGVFKVNWFLKDDKPAKINKQKKKGASA